MVYEIFCLRERASIANCSFPRILARKDMAEILLTSTVESLPKVGAARVAEESQQQHQQSKQSIRAQRHHSKANKVCQCLLDYLQSFQP